MDVDGDQFEDIILGGNLYGVQPEMGRYDASYGHVLINQRNGNFKDKSIDYGFSVPGEIRDVKKIGRNVFVFRNNDTVAGFQINKNE
jgi:hypothetical protein